MAKNYEIGNKFTDSEGNISEITAIDRKAKTVILTHWDGVEEGPMQYATLRKKFKPYEAPVDEDGEEIVDAVCSDGTPYAEVFKEIVAGAEAKAEAAVAEKKKRKRGVKKSFEELVALLPAYSNMVFKRMSNGSVAVKCGNQRLFRFDTAGNQYKFVADRVSHFDGVDDVIVHADGNKKWAEVRTSDVKSMAEKIIKNARILGAYIA